MGRLAQEQTRAIEAKRPGWHESRPPAHFRLGVLPTQAPGALIQLQRAVGNLAVTDLVMADSNRASCTQAMGLPLQRDHERLIETGRLVAARVEPCLSWSLGGRSKKPLAVIYGRLDVGPGPREVIVHVHLNAEDPLVSFSGANVRWAGESKWFAYWSPGSIAATPWLQNILADKLPAWHIKGTWTSLQGSDSVTWSNAMRGRTPYQVAQDKATRRTNELFNIWFTTSRRKGGVETQRKRVTEFLPADAEVTVVNAGGTRKVTITFADEQQALESSDGLWDSIKVLWSTAKDFGKDAETVPWP